MFMSGQDFLLARPKRIYCGLQHALPFGTGETTSNFTHYAAGWRRGATNLKYVSHQWHMTCAIILSRPCTPYLCLFEGAAALPYSISPNRSAIFLHASSLMYVLVIHQTISATSSNLHGNSLQGFYDRESPAKALNKINFETRGNTARYRAKHWCDRYASFTWTTEGEKRTRIQIS